MTFKSRHLFVEILLAAAVEICKYKQPGKEERTVAVKRLTSQAAVDIAQFASEANILRKLVNEYIAQPSALTISSSTLLF